MRAHSLVADFGAIVHWRKPDNPVKDGALSEPFLASRTNARLEKRSRKVDVFADSSENEKEVAERL
jgi:hypothetical protein